MNGLEFPLFDHYELSRMQIGYALGAWGVGNFIVLFLPSRIESMLSVSQLTFFFASFLGVVFLVPNPWSVIFSMGIAAFFYSILAGRIKGQINTEMPSDMSPLEVWAYFGQRTGMINIIFYLLCAALLLLNIDIARGIFCAFLGIYTFETFRKSVPIQKTEITNGNEFNV